MFECVFVFRRHRWYAINIACKRFCLLRSMLQFRVLSLFVNLVHYAQTAEDIDIISFTYDSPCIFHFVLTSDICRSTPSSPNFAQKWPNPCWL